MTPRLVATALLASLLAASLTAHASFVDEKGNSVTTKVVYVRGYKVNMHLYTAPGQSSQR